MKQKARKLLSLLLAVCLLAAAPLAASAEDPILIYEVGDKQYLGLNRLTGELVNATQDLPANLVIPSQIQGYTVTSIADKLFYGRESLMAVTVPGTVERIGDQAFTSCRALQSVTLQAGVKNLGKSAFRYCYSLRSVSLPATLTSIESYTFESCLALESITVPEGVTAIAERAFAKCGKLTDVKLPGTVTSIGEYAFSDCTSLRSIVLPSRLQALSTALFNGCTALTDVTVPSSVKTVGKSAFGDCSSLQRLVLPEGVERIEDWAFNGCASLTMLSLPDSVKSISGDAFYGCNNVTFYVNAGSYSQVFASANKRPFVVGTLDPSDPQDDLGNYPATPFADDKSHWGRKYIEWAYANGYIAGVSATAFGPNDSISRGQLVTILYNVEGRPAAGTSSFTDLTYEYYKKPIAWAQANNVVAGADSTHFLPDRPITRQQLAIVLYNYARKKGKNVSASGDLSQFKDTDQIGSSYGAAMRWAVGAGIISGMGDSSLNPRGTATRAQAAVMLYKVTKLR